MRDYLPEIIAILLLIAAVIFGVNKAAMNDEKLWNDGHCDICGGAWKYEQAVGHNARTSYIYVCEGCGKRIEINEMRWGKIKKGEYKW